MNRNTTTGDNNHLSHLLAKWHPNRDKSDWVLATIYDTKGPCYRKAGAMMLFSSQGDQLGMLSGGCLESDISINAKKVLQTGQSISLCYDGSDEDDVSFQLGIGCGGTVYIMLQQINAKNNYLSLIDVFDALNSRTSGYYYQRIIDKSIKTKNTDPNDSCKKNYFQAQSISDIAEAAKMTQYIDLIKKPTLANQTIDNTNGSVVSHDKTHEIFNSLTPSPYWLVNPIVPEPHLLVIGGGIDVRPLVNMAKELGWQVSLWDPRPANARKEFFSTANHIINGDADTLTTFTIQKSVNAAVLMSHNILIDAQALHALSHVKLEYLGLLGPEKRRQQVVNQAKTYATNEDVVEGSLPLTFAGPSGLNIGGTLPESIALSIISECHAVLYRKNAQSMSLEL